MIGSRYRAEYRAHIPQSVESESLASVRPEEKSLATRGTMESGISGSGQFGVL